MIRDPHHLLHQITTPETLLNLEKTLEDIDHVAGLHDSVSPGTELDGFPFLVLAGDRNVILSRPEGEAAADRNRSEHRHTCAGIGVLSRFLDLTQDVERAVGEYLYADAGIDDIALRKAFLDTGRSEEHTSELQSLMRISYAVFCLKK